MSLEPSPERDNVDSDGLRRVGIVDFRSDRLALTGTLTSIVMVGAYFVVPPFYDPKEPAPGVTVLVLFVLIGFFAANRLPKLLLRESRYRVTVHLDSGERLRVKYRSSEAQSLVAKGRAKAEGEFRPRAMEDGVVQVELRRNWKGRNEWLLFLPEHVPDRDLETHLERFLPLLTDTLERAAMQ